MGFVTGGEQRQMTMPPTSGRMASGRTCRDTERISPATSERDWLTQTFQPTPGTVAKPARRSCRSSPV